MKTFKKLCAVAIFILIIVIVIGLLGKVLSNTVEIESHNLKGATRNSVYISEDGHKEAVYDLNEELVTDPVNMGSYNYYHYKEHPLKHFFFDTLPWIIFGNAEDDTSTVVERSIGFSKDLAAGVRATFK